MTLDEQNRDTFTRYNIGDKLRIVNRISYKDGQVTYAVITGFDMNAVGEILLRLNELGLKETRLLHPNNNLNEIEKL